MQFWPETDNGEDESNCASVELLDLRSKIFSQMPEFYERILPKIVYCFDQSNRASERLLHLKSKNGSHMTDFR